MPPVRSQSRLADVEQLGGFSGKVRRSRGGLRGTDSARRVNFSHAPAFTAFRNRLLLTSFSSGGRIRAAYGYSSTGRIALPRPTFQLASPTYLLFPHHRPTCSSVIMAHNPLASSSRSYFHNWHAESGSFKGLSAPTRNISWVGAWPKPPPSSVVLGYPLVLQ